MRSLLAGYPAAALCYQITLVTNYSMEPAPKGLYARGGTANSVLNRYSLSTATRAHSARRPRHSC